MTGYLGFWLFGWMVTSGMLLYATTDEDDDQPDWLITTLMVLFAIICWPMVMGFWVMSFLEAVIED